MLHQMHCECELHWFSTEWSFLANEKVSQQLEATFRVVALYANIFNSNEMDVTLKIVTDIRKTFVQRVW